MDPIIGTVNYFCWSWQMRGWMPCRGQLLSVNQHQSLYALVGNNYGGDIRNNTFALPDLRPWDIDAPDTGKRIKRDWHPDELVPHIAVEGMFPSRE
jgi:microcystin-dependent protein